VRSKTLKQWLPFFLWTVLIFVGSSIPRLPGNPFGLPTWSDKVAHFLEYLILAFLFYRGIRGERWRMGIPAWLVVISTGLVIASIDEYHQMYIPGRDSNILDWTADMAGVATGALIGMRRYRGTAGGPERA
jgi:VanZ family protein